jgi:tRNA pseudouridine38-40 synthase
MRPHDLVRCQLLIRFGYDGARFRGVQPQGVGIPTAGAALKQRLVEAAGAPPSALNFAARTDAGVHAIANLATCYFRDIGEARDNDIRRRLEIPREDGLLHVRAHRVPPAVHARGSARGKRYRYVVDDGAIDAAARPARSWSIAPTLDIDAMKRAACHFEGKNDFSSLRAGGCSASSATKTLTRVRIGGPFDLGQGQRRILVELTGDAFLRKMVRNLVGVLVEVGVGLRAADDVVSVLAARDRSAAGLCAPPEGLALMMVGCAWPDDGSGLIRELVPGLASAARAGLD